MKRSLIMTLVLVAGLSTAHAQRKDDAGNAGVRLIKWVEPEYTEEAKAAKIYGTVVVTAVITEAGKAENIEIVRKLGYGLDEKAVEALKQWIWSPARKNGEPVAIRGTIEINFHRFERPLRHPEQ